MIATNERSFYLQQSFSIYSFPGVLASRLVLPILLLFAVCDSFAQAPISIPMKADRWIANGNATFTTGDHSPAGVLEISKGPVDAKDVTFADGAIDFDMYMPEKGILGIRFRTQNRENGEALFFRPQKNCEVSTDCLQYMPLEHGAYEWDLFPEDQSAAPIHTLSWNHFRVVVLGRKMRVYVNGSSRPSLIVDHMEGSALSGGLTFGGPAKYANLVITPATPSPVNPMSEPNDGFLRHWQISAASVLPSVIDKKLDAPMGVQPPYSSKPPNGKSWRPVTAETKGLINLSHEVGSAKDGSVISVAWAKTTLVSDKAQVKTVQIGFVREVWVYVNGVLVFTERNVEGHPAADANEERISLGNGTFRLPLKKGKNEIAIALDDNLPGNTQHYGWGMELKLSESVGVLVDSKQ